MYSGIHIQMYVYTHVYMYMRKAIYWSYSLYVCIYTRMYVKILSFSGESFCGW